MGCVTCECYLKQNECEKKVELGEVLTKINGRYRHIKRKSSQVACRQFIPNMLMLIYEFGGEMLHQNSVRGYLGLEYLVCTPF